MYIHVCMWERTRESDFKIVSLRPEEKDLG